MGREGRRARRRSRSPSVSPRILDDAPLVLDGHRLVNLRVTALSSARDKDTQLTRVTLRLRAVTEVA